MNKNEAIATLCAQNTSFMILKPTQACEYMIYSVHDSAGKTIFVGYDNIVDVVTFDRLRRDPAFDPDQYYSIVTVSTAKTLHEAQVKAIEYRKSLCGLAMPQFNMTTSVNRRGGVRCNETGEVWRTASEACKSLQVSPSNMSQHLAKRIGHKTIKGKTFSYTEFYAIDDQGRLSFSEKVS